MSTPTHEAGDARSPRVASSRRIQAADDDREAAPSKSHATHALPLAGDTTNDATSFVSPLVRLLAPGSHAGRDREEEHRERVPTTPLEWVLYDFIAFAHAMRVDCCFLRGYENLPAPPKHAKIHLLVRPAHVADLMDLFEQAARRHGAAIIDRWTGVAVSGFTLYAYRAPAEHGFVEIDVHTEITCASTPYLGAEEVLPGRHYARDVRIPLPVHEAVIQLLDRWLGDGELAPEDVRPAEGIAAQHPRHFREVTAELLGSALARELCDHAARGELALLAKDAPRYRRAVIRRAWSRRPLRCVGTRLAEIARRIRQPLLEPRGRFIVVLGRDAAARFDILEWLTKELRFVVQGRASIVDSTRENVGYRGEQAVQENDGALRHLIAAWARCIRVYARAVLPHQRELSLILRDDYPYAAFMAPMRAGVRRGSTLARLLSKCMPHPDAVFVLRPDDRLETNTARTAEESCEVWTLGDAGFAPFDIHPGAADARDRLLCAVVSGGAGT